VRESADVADVTVANVKFPNIDGVVEAIAIGGKGMASPSPGYVSLYFSLPQIDNVVAGSYAEVYLPRNDSRKVIAVPYEALTDRMGQKMVYVKEADEDHYRRVTRPTGATDGRLVEVTRINSGHHVVTEGVTFVRLAENAGAVPPGHTHNH
ncbi:MAG: efflux RND transporter periplasmic adaptor subunit, partial [Muribaculaceae bacterium]|nr:efflux RND transporter periplasmic adaptor subunit [Muribaculaceae bacterium]